MIDGESSLLGLILVVASPRNSNQVVFSYPVDPKPILRLSRPVYNQPVAKKKRRKTKKRSPLPAATATASSSSSTSSSETSDDEGTDKKQPVKSKSRRQSSSAAAQPHIQNGLRQSSPSPMPGYDSQSSSTSDEGSIDEDWVNGSEEEDKPEEGQESPSPISALFHAKLAAHRNLTAAGDLSAQANAAYSQFLGIDVDILSTCLLKRGLRDSKLEFVIDYLAFIGHPVWLDRGRQRAKEEQERTASVNASRKNSFDAVSIVSQSARGRSPPPAAESSTNHESSQPEYDASESAGHASPEVMRPKQMSDPVSPLPSSKPLPPSKPPSIRQNSDRNNQDGDLTMFNLVLIIDTPPDKHLSSHLDVYYQDVVVKLTAAIKFEELKDGWLSREAAEIFRMREKAKDQNLPFAAHTAELISTSSLCAALAKAFDCIRKGEIAKLSNLNDDLDMSIMLHDELFKGSPFGVEQAALKIGLADGRMDGESGGLKPWQTVVALEDPKDMLGELDGGALAAFVEILTPTVNFREYTTLLDLEYYELQELVDHLVYWRKARIVNVVNVRNTYTLNPAKSLAKLAYHSFEFADTFPDFLPLISILGMLSRSQPFVSIIPHGQRRAYYVDVLIWLLRMDLILQQREFYRLIVNPQIRQQTRDARRFAGSSDDADSQQERTDDGGASSFDGRIYTGKSVENRFFDGANEPSSPIIDSSLPKAKSLAVESAQSTPEPSPELTRRARQPKSSMASLPRRERTAAFASSALPEPLSNVIDEPSQPTVWEKRWINQILASQPDHAEQFEKILPYLNGSMDVDEIAYRSGLSRKEVKGLCNTFSDHICPFSMP